MSRILSVPRRLVAWGALLILAGTPLTLAAEDAPPADQFKVGLSANIGTEAVNGVAYNLLGFIPDVSYGKLGVGLDLSFHFQLTDASGKFGFYPRAADWYDDTLSMRQNVDNWLGRIAYVRWGQKGDPLYVQAGLLPGTTLGTGFLVGNYSNGALRPAQKYIGLEVDADGSLINLPYGGVQSFVGNISEFDVLGFRAYAKPFGLLMPENAFLKEMQFGLTLATDTNPYAQSSATGSGVVVAYGLDSMLPLYQNDLVSALGTADLAFEGAHAGASLGFSGQLVKLITWGLTPARFLGENFIPDYFDLGYEANRLNKYAVYSNKVTIPATVGWQASLGTSLLGGQLAFGAILSGPWTSESNVFAQPQLVGYSNVKIEGFPIVFDAHYVKNGVTSLTELTSAQNALVGAKVGYTMGAVTLNIIYDLRYRDNGAAGWVSTSRVETAMKFF